jgi:hypothetical protein
MMITELLMAGAVRHRQRIALAVPTHLTECLARPQQPRAESLISAIGARRPYVALLPIPHYFWERFLSFARMRANTG